MELRRLSGLIRAEIFFSLRMTDILWDTEVVEIFLIVCDAFDLDERERHYFHKTVHPYSMVPVELQTKLAYNECRYLC